MSGGVKNNNFSSFPYEHLLVLSDKKAGITSTVGSDLLSAIGDSDKTYLTNLKNNKSKLEKYGWVDTKIKYEVNSYGFRSNDFNENEGIIFLGCSQTFGTGLSVEDTFPFLLSQKLKLECWNLSIPGSGLDTCYRIAKYWIPKLNAKNVFLICTQPSRREVFVESNFRAYLPEHNLDPTGSLHPFSLLYDKIIKKFYNLIVVEETNNYINFQKNIDAIKLICIENNCNLNIANVYSKNWGISKKIIVPYKKCDKARDLMHYGVNWNYAAFEWLYDEFKENF
jgi:hypothetical protein